MELFGEEQEAEKEGVTEKEEVIAVIVCQFVEHLNSYEFRRTNCKLCLWIKAVSKK